MHSLIPTPVIARMHSLGGILTRADLDELDVSSAEASRWVDQGALKRARRRAFVDPEMWSAANRHARQRLETRAIARSLTHQPRQRPHLVAAGSTAASAWGLPVLTPHLDAIHLARTGAGTAERVGNVRIQTCWGEETATVFAGVPVLHLAPALISLATTSGLDAAVVAMDAALHESRVGIDELHEWMLRCDGRRGIRAARKAIDMADPASESPGESLTRLILNGLGVDHQSQAWVDTDRGRFRVDFLVAGRVVVEFDGAVKYDGIDGRDALMAEKRREDALRRAGYVVVRLTWADLRDPRAVCTLIMSGLDQRRAC